MIILLQILRHELLIHVRIKLPFPLVLLSLIPSSAVVLSMIPASGLPATCPWIGACPGVAASPSYACFSTGAGGAPARSDRRSAIAAFFGDEQSNELTKRLAIRASLREACVVMASWAGACLTNRPEGLLGLVLCL